MLNRGIGLTTKRSDKNRARSNQEVARNGNEDGVKKRHQAEEKGWNEQEDTPEAET
jgi:hypothetical protein